MKIRVLTFLAVGILLVGSSLSAHHGTGISYDMSKLVTLNGTVTQFVWSNPHCYVSIDVKDESGKIEHWNGEMNSPGVLKQSGWSRTTLKAGDQITLSVNPSKAGATVGVVNRSKPVIANGKPVLAAGGNSVD